MELDGVVRKHIRLDSEGKETGEKAVAHSVLEAIKLGIWDYEPDEPQSSSYSSTRAMPGTGDKLQVMAERVKRGLPLWHPEDRRTYDESDLIET